MSKRITMQVSRDGVSAVVQAPIRPDGASAHAFGDLVDAALALLWGALDEYAEEDGAVVVVDTMPEEAATGDGDDAAR